jgi:hypothetical protein
MRPHDLILSLSAVTLYESARTAKQKGSPNREGMMITRREAITGIGVLTLAAYARQSAAAARTSEMAWCHKISHRKMQPKR